MMYQHYRSMLRFYTSLELKDLLYEASQEYLDGRTVIPIGSSIVLGRSSYEEAIHWLRGTISEGCVGFPYLYGQSSNLYERGLEVYLIDSDESSKEESHEEAKSPLGMDLDCNMHEPVSPSDTALDVDLRAEEEEVFGFPIERWEWGNKAAPLEFL